MFNPFYNDLIHQERVCGLISFVLYIDVTCTRRRSSIAVTRFVFLFCYFQFKK